MSQPKKCIIIGPAFPLRGGVAQLLESLSLEFSKQGIENKIYSFSLQFPSFLFPGETQTEASDRRIPEGLKVHSTINSINPFTWWNTARLIAKEKPDFVVVPYWVPFMGPVLGTVVKWLKKCLDVPVVGLMAKVVRDKKGLSKNGSVKYFIEQCDSFVVMSSKVMEDLSMFNQDKPRKLLHHPVNDHFGENVPMDLARKHLSIPVDQKVILFFGMVRKRKGLKLLLEAVSKMENKEKLKLVVAGEFSGDRDKYTRLIKKYKLENHVMVNAGFVDKYKVKYYFCAADIVAQPYLSATQSGVTQVAYHFETPMLVTNVGGLSEVVPHEKVGYVCEVDSTGISKTLSAFFDENKGGAFRKNIKSEKKRFEWDFFAREITELAIN